MKVGISRASGRVTPHQPSGRQRLTARVLTASLRALALSCRWRLEDAGGGFALARARPVIFVVWHNRLAFSIPIYARYIQAETSGRRMAAMVSASRDGGFLAAVLDAFGVQPVRGSSSRRGPQALLEMTSWAERGFDLAITPDGPRGPRYQVQPGVLALAAVTGLPIVPVSLNTRWRVNVRSWDRFQVPLPFGCCTVLSAAPLVIADAEPARLEAARQELQARMRAVTLD